MNIDVFDKVIVITGSSRGIGRALAIKFAQEGASVVINYVSNYEEARELFDYINTFNNRCIMFRADVSDENDVRKLYDETIKNFGTVDILINNAGICNDNYIQFMTYDQWNSVIGTNLSSVFLCSRIFSKAMIKKRKGKIINIASVKGRLGSEGQCNYSASKAGMIGFTKSLAKEVGGFNISVNAVCPGFIVTDLNRTNENKKRIAKEMSALSTNGGLNDLVNFVLFLSSDNLSGVSGQVFQLDSRIK